MPGGYGLYAAAGVGTGLDLASSAEAASGTLKIPSTAARPAVTNGDRCRRIGFLPSAGVLAYANLTRWPNPRLNRDRCLERCLLRKSWNSLP